ncbi:MAG: hypothetical protein J5931_07330 [Prevotella sp.]|nr:hypothetical protein [Prevotella sp.]
MKELRLILQKKFAREIVAGTKKREYREYTPFYVSRLIDFKGVSDRTIKLDNGAKATPIHFDAIRFDWYHEENILVELKGWTVFTVGQAKTTKADFLGESAEKTCFDIFKDEFEIADAPDGDMFIVFNLGRIIENNSDIK